MISYLGLEWQLRKSNKDRTYLHEELGLSWDTIAKFKKGESVTIATLEKLCVAFDCKIEDIVEIKKGPSN